ncbi:Larval cuticle protein 16/17 [Amphibalanus amphitrite]|uniref:Larval cuticle protein 16/17 n=1 Tax=Amphibalanus amphitrite TaxID=1232801 RepID=A0A6A4UT59_AMPAM|nr:Larval cuticle protein 16/17 [Amphibalanus amphitrite]
MIGGSSIFSDDILRSEFEMADDGQFQYGFETRDGIVVDAAGENRQIGDGVGAVMRGSYSYTSPEGIDVTINWEADENGFRASGDQVPAVPERPVPSGAAEQAVAAVEEEAAAAADAAAVSVPVVSAPAVVVADPAESVVPDESAFIVLEADSETAEQEELLS